MSSQFDFPQDAYSNQILNNSLGKEKVWVRIPLGAAESSDGVTVALKKKRLVIVLNRVACVV